MNTEQFIKAMNTQEKVKAGSETHKEMTRLSNEAMKLTARLNQG